MGKSESQMDIMEKTAKPRRHGCSLVEIGLSIMLLLTSCALAGMIVLYASANICMTPDCVTAAARLLQNMDPRVDPCQNFYQHACGGWLERHVIPESSSLHSVFNVLRDELEIVLKGKLGHCGCCCCVSHDWRKAAALPPAGVIEQRTSQPLLKLIDAMGDWPVASEGWSKEPLWLEDTLATLNTRYNRKVLLDMFVWPDDRDSSHHVIHIDQPSLGMPSRDYYFNNGNYKKAYLQFMVSMAIIAREDRNLTQEDERVWEEMMQVLALERDIANATSTAEARSDITVLYNKMTLSDLQETFGLDGFNWTHYIQEIMASVSVVVQADEPIVVYCTPYLEQLDRVLSRYNRRTVQNYLVWMLVMDRVGTLSRRFKDVRAYYRKVLHGTTVEEARWRDCVRYVQSSMENAVGALYVRETFAGDSKRMGKWCEKKIREAYVETLEELNWMDDQSNAKAREKALAISEQIGYPDYILQEENQKLDEEYIHLNFSEESYFENSLQNLQATAQKGHKRLREPVDSDLWIIGAAVVNAFYSHNRNQIVFPAGILQPPFFSEKQLQALNFGGIGMVIGHEITHGFDDHGRNFDKNGNMQNWWSNYSTQHFEEQSKCMVQQYSRFTWKLSGDQNVSGITTLGENIADNGGLRQAYKAYMKWLEREGEEPGLPGLDMDHKQLFFLNFAQIWCGACRPEYAIQSIKTDPHSPLEYRVLGSLQNFDAFSEAFQCERGTPMNPEEKCRVW
uniref:Membrane metallo-endopeptidase-like 1 n=1 Tax=Electrophorus electricus TaxID=8005 RepID=A0A4W4HEI0_ELEEL